MFLVCFGLRGGTGRIFLRIRLRTPSFPNPRRISVGVICYASLQNAQVHRAQRCRSSSSHSRGPHESPGSSRCHSAAPYCHSSLRHRWPMRQIPIGVMARSLFPRSCVSMFLRCERSLRIGELLEPRVKESKRAPRYRRENCSTMYRKRLLCHRIWPSCPTDAAFLVFCLKMRAMN